MAIGRQDLAKKLKVTVKTLINWELNGLITPLAKTSDCSREKVLFSDSEVKRCSFIKSLMRRNINRTSIQIVLALIDADSISIYDSKLDSDLVFDYTTSKSDKIEHINKWLNNLNLGYEKSRDTSEARRVTSIKHKNI